METMVRLAIERMNEELEKLKSQVQQQQDEIDELKNAAPVVQPAAVSSKEDEYLDSRDVQKILGVCYNTLQKIVKQGFIKPIRINQRRFRYSRKAVFAYLNDI
jgi:hypothetical protein